MGTLPLFTTCALFKQDTPQHPQKRIVEPRDPLSTKRLMLFLTKLYLPTYVLGKKDGKKKITSYHHVFLRLRACAREPETHMASTSRTVSLGACEDLSEPA